MWEKNETKGQRVVKQRGDPNLLFKAKGKKPDVSFTPLADDMKAINWRTLQGIKDETVICAILSRVISKELSMEEMAIEFEQ